MTPTKGSKSAKKGQLEPTDEAKRRETVNNNEDWGRFHRRRPQEDPGIEGLRPATRLASTQSLHLTKRSSAEAEDIGAAPLTTRRDNESKLQGDGSRRNAQGQYDNVAPTLVELSSGIRMSEENEENRHVCGAGKKKEATKSLRVAPAVPMVVDEGTRRSVSLTPAVAPLPQVGAFQVEGINGVDSDDDGDTTLPPNDGADEGDTIRTSDQSSLPEALPAEVVAPLPAPPGDLVVAETIHPTEPVDTMVCRMKRRPAQITIFIVAVLVLVAAAVVGAAVAIMTAGDSPKNDQPPDESVVTNKTVSTLSLTFTGMQPMSVEASIVWESASVDFFVKVFATDMRATDVTTMYTFVDQFSPARRLRSRRMQEPELSVVYDQVVSYRQGSAEMTPVEVAMAPFDTMEGQQAYRDALVATGHPAFMTLESVTSVQTPSPTRSPTSNPLPSFGPTSSPTALTTSPTSGPLPSFSPTRGSTTLTTTSPTLGPRPSFSPTSSPTTDEPLTGDWTQIGQDLMGAATGDNFGNALDLSSDGQVLAVGTPGSDAGAGRVHVFQRVNGLWVQLGRSLVGENAWDRFGGSVSLSADGRVLAVGARWNDDGSRIDLGQVRVFHLVNGSWVALGQTLAGENGGDWFGTSVILSSDGSVLAAGARYGNGVSSTGQVRVFQLVNGLWVPFGEALIGENVADGFGNAVSLSSDGRVLAVGAPGNDDNNIRRDSGHVRMFQSLNGSWVPMGQTLKGGNSGDEFGWSVSLSSDGRVLAVGATNGDDSNGSDSGHVRVFQWLNGSWVPLGGTLAGENIDDRFGKSVSVSSDGRVLAVGADENGDNGDRSGHVRVFQLVAGSWAQIGSDLDGMGSLDYFGGSVALSADGKSVACGAPERKSDSLGPGYAIVYQLET